MNKPLSEWTLGEVQKYCKITQCGDCCIGLWCENINKGPSDWDLSEPPRWTEDEIEFAKIFQAACKNKIFFERLNDSQILMWGEEGLGSYSNILPHKLLPSLKEGERVTASEIIGGGE